MESVDEVLAKQIEKEQKERASKKRSGLMSPSSLGQCYRRQYYNRLNEPVTNPIPIETLKVFRIGNVVHKDIQGLLDKNKVEVEFTEGDIHGFIDHLEDDYVEDFKTIGTWRWKRITKAGYDINEKVDYILQLMTYVFCMKKRFGLLTFINKDTYETLTFRFEMEKWVDMVNDELAINRGFWNKQKLPPAMPRLYSNKNNPLKECAYCSWKKTCWEEKGWDVGKK